MYFMRVSAFRLVELTFCMGIAKRCGMHWRILHCAARLCGQGIPKNCAKHGVLHSALRTPIQWLSMAEEALPCCATSNSIEALNRPRYVFMYSM